MILGKTPKCLLFSLEQKYQRQKSTTCKVVSKALTCIQNKKYKAENKKYACTEGQTFWKQYQEDQGLMRAIAKQISDYTDHAVSTGV